MICFSSGSEVLAVGSGPQLPVVQCIVWLGIAPGEGGLSVQSVFPSSALAELSPVHSASAG